MAKPTKVILAAFSPLHPYCNLPKSKYTKIIHANKDKLVFSIISFEKIFSKKRNPDNRLIDKDITPKTRNLNKSISIVSSGGRELTIVDGLFLCNRPSCNFKKKACVAHKHIML
tara:strand:+ start:2860 stop:3201 length:342 start_codon:yes stop_codon:yes gene_type:complete